MKTLVSLALVLLLSACASSHVLVGQARQPINPEQVRIYLDPPANYETVALLESSNRGALNFTDQQRTNTVIARMKEEAAELGANGILLKGMGKEYAGSVGSGSAWASGNSAYGMGVSTAVFNKVGSGIAIYVPNGDTYQQGILVGTEQGAQESAPRVTTPAPVTSGVEETSPPAVQPRNGAQPPAAVPYEPDPSKRCDACARMTNP